MADPVLSSGVIVQARGTPIAVPSDGIGIVNDAGTLKQQSPGGTLSSLGGGGNGYASGTALTNASQTLQPATDVVSQYSLTATLTADRTKTLGVTSAVAGDLCVINCPASMAFALIVANGGTNAGTLYTAAAAVAKAVQLSFFYNGVDWVLVGRAFLSAS